MIVDLRIAGFLPVIALLAAACGGDTNSGETNDATAAEPGSLSSTTLQYDWYLEGETPAGETTLVISGDGRVTNESFVHWNNREWTVNSELQLDPDGRVIAQTITGISPFQAPIDEQFAIEDGVATWKTIGEDGSATADPDTHYYPDVDIAFGTLTALVRAARNSFDNEVALYPAGRATVDKLRTVSVDTPDGAQNLTLFAINGAEFTPVYLWFDADMQLAAYDKNGDRGMVPKGWDKSVLVKLSAAQSDESARWVSNAAGELAHRVDGPVVFENVDVIDVVTGELLEGRHVRVEDGRIGAISADAIDDADALRIDATGKTMLPGLWDMHGHFALSDGVLNIAGGITNVRDIGSVHEKIMELTEKFDSGEVIGPNTWRAGFMDKAGPFASGKAAATLDEALEIVDFYAEHGYVQIKLYSSIEPEWVAPIAERAHGHGMRLSGHIPAFMSAEQAVEAGYDEIQHINMVFLNFLAGDREDTRKQLRFTLYGDEAASVDLDSDEVQAFFMLLRENDVVVDATAAIFDTMLTHVPGEPDPTFAAVGDHLPAAIRRSLYVPDMTMGENWPAGAVRQAEMLKALHDNGIQIVPGSDHHAAFTLHRELELYAESGIPVADVLRIGTLDSAALVGAADRKGSIEVGKDSDLLIVDGNPLEDISAIRRGVLVMKGDTLYRPEDLYPAVGVEPFLPSLVL